MLAALLDLVLPRTCSGCEAPGTGLCRGCVALLSGEPVGAVQPTPCPVGLPPVVSLLTYDGEVKRLLLAHKERGRLFLTKPLGAGLGSAVLQHGRAPVLLCPVPSSPKAVRDRGHDHALRLARAAAASVSARGVPAVATPLLRSARAVADQSGLTTAERARNLSGALRAVGVPGLSVVVVDDVMTTGATLVEATRALREQGHEVVGAAVIAATQRKHAAQPTPPNWV